MCTAMPSRPILDTGSRWVAKGGVYKSRQVAVAYPLLRVEIEEVEIE